MTNHTSIALNEALAYVSDEPNEENINYLFDVIDFDTITAGEVNAIMTELRKIDPTESDVAAEMRDYIRDNTDIEV
jgi:hypothetical protein